ncbi:beta-1,3-galactosyltransferase 1-like [Gigantopelta aegis]|uniref:beta-1,3-galactosyltransferase 1-like n=1 Tax=Gigantopelta aegis TaxID=1735272 RepID=UPI001B88BE42|nr:beta-1,3-galactosyltransferase 1-like [Gigantopelta aegis]
MTNELNNIVVSNLVHLPAMCVRMIKKCIVLLLPCRTVILCSLVACVYIFSIILVYQTSVHNWRSKTRIQIFDLKQRILFINGTTSNLTFSTTTVSTIQTDQKIRHLFDNRLTAVGYKSTKRHPYLRNLLISSIDVCREKSVDLLIYFFSAWTNCEKRRLLRETWASVNTFHNLTIRTVFFLGKPNSASDQKKIRIEAAAYGDIVQGDFIDSFKNKSMKALTCLKWINDYCIHAKYVIKADDSIFVNIFKVVEHILPMLSSKHTTVACHFKKKGTSVIVRDQKSIWFVSNDVFPGQKHFPDFCTGYAVIFTSDVIPKLYEASFRAPFIPIDDVYIFGVLPQFFKSLQYIDIKQNCTLNKEVALKQYQHSTSEITYVVANAWEDGNMHAYWLAAISKLSSWASRQSRLTNLRQNKCQTIVC